LSRGIELYCMILHVKNEVSGARQSTKIPSSRSLTSFVSSCLDVDLSLEGSQELVLLDGSLEATMSMLG